MLKIKSYVRPQTLEEAYQLCQKKGNVVLGGMLWLKMQNRSINTAIDLQDLGLDQIEETDEEYRIGAMVTLRDLEQHGGFNALTHGAMAESVKHIVGVQFPMWPRWAAAYTAASAFRMYRRCSWLSVRRWSCITAAS